MGYRLAWQGKAGFWVFFESMEGQMKRLVCMAMMIFGGMTCAHAERTVDLSACDDIRGTIKVSGLGTAPCTPLGMLSLRPKLAQDGVVTIVTKFTSRKVDLADCARLYRSEDPLDKYVAEAFAVCSVIGHEPDKRPVAETPVCQGYDLRNAVKVTGEFKMGQMCDIKDASGKNVDGGNPMHQSKVTSGTFIAQAWSVRLIRPDEKSYFCLLDHALTRYGSGQHLPGESCSTPLGNGIVPTKEQAMNYLTH